MELFGGSRALFVKNRESGEGGEKAKIRQESLPPPPWGPDFRLSLSTISVTTM